MTEKKQRILEVALELFAREGYNAVPTSRIARKAQVSEGLIFRHFESKKGLLEALIKDAEQRLQKLWVDVLLEEDPELVIRKAIELPFKVDQAEYGFWKLQFKLKWEEAYYRPEKTKPFVDRLTWAFRALRYEQPELEARFLEQAIDAIGTSILRDGKEIQGPYRDFLLKKYGV